MLAPRTAFTLIELLVVITIIVVLLALLTPALDKAIYEAELTQCMATARGIASASIVYAMDHRRRFPHREDVQGDDLRYQFSSVANIRDGRADVGGGYDMRAKMKEYLAAKMFAACPLSTEVDVEDNGSLDNVTITSDYAIFFGWAYLNKSGMSKLGDRMPGAKGDRFTVLASDVDSFDTANDLSWASHPDNNKLSEMVWQNFGDPARDPQASAAAYGAIVGDPSYSWTWSRFDCRGDGTQSAMEWYRSPVDDNFAFADGSASRHRKVTLDPDEQLPEDTSLGIAGFYRMNAGTMVILPKN